MTFVSLEQSGLGQPNKVSQSITVKQDADYDVRVLRQPRSGKFNWLSFQLFVRFSDIALVLLGACLASLIRFDTLAISDPHIALVMIAVMALLLSSEVLKLYSERQIVSSYRSSMKWIAAWSIAMTVVFGFLFFTKSGAEYSRLWVFYWFVGALILVVPARFIFARWCRRLVMEGSMGEYIALVGTPENVWIARRALDDKVQLGMVIMDKRRHPGTIEAEMELALTDVDRVILAVDHCDDARVRTWLDLCRRRCLHLVLAPSLTPELLDYEPHQIGGLPVWRLSTKPLSDSALLIKRVEDLVLGSLLTLSVAPLLLFIAIAIKIESRGPVLFRQMRHGFNNTTFTVYKFRSMEHAEETSGNVVQASRADPRVTRVGWFLRRSSLDELPQLFNVLRGEMSLVGPRPHAVPHNHLYGKQIEDYFRRHRLKPGITGWAQVNALRGETRSIDKMRARVEHDLYYIDNWSLALDLRILLRTVTVMVHPTAY